MHSKLSNLLLPGLIVLGATLLFFFNPEAVRYPPCFFKMITGLQCPGCGSARASYHLLHGHLLTAIDYNLLFTAALPLVAIEGISRLFLLRKNPILKFGLFNYIKAWQVMLVVIIFWLVRNLPAYPFTWLSSDH